MTRELNRNWQKLKKANISILFIFFNFFRFTIHEHGIYDLPAGLKKCLAVTGKIYSSIFEIELILQEAGGL